MMKARKGLRDALFYAAAAGLLISGYVTFSGVFGRKLLCIGAAGCSTVQVSAYAKQFGLPVALWGLVAYIALALLAVRWTERGDARPAWMPLAAFGITLTGTLYSAYLTAIEAWALHAYCSWCLASAAIQVVALGITLLLVRAEGRASAG